jgi:membrane-associated phospholipid phosphatase
MFVARKIACLLRVKLVQGLVLLTCSGIAYPKYLQAENFVKTQSIQSNNFYKTDSIFSFRSSKGYVPSLLHNFGEQVTAPLHFKTKQWLLTGATIGITAFLINNDGDIDNWARTQKQKHNWINKLSPVITEFGGSYGIYSVGAIGIISVAYNNKKGVETSLLATQAMITSGVWVQIIKQVTGRERPIASYSNSKEEGGQWYGPFAQYDQDLAIKKPGSSFDAFASGHTATAFSIATVFASQYNNTPVIPIISYSAATLIGVSRLTEHAHWASDIFVGALLGYLCGKQVVKHFNKTHPSDNTSMLPKQKTKTELSLIQNGNQIGVSLKW